MRLFQNQELLEEVYMKIDDGPETQEANKFHSFWTEMIEKLY
jgi:hypothetical protein